MILVINLGLKSIRAIVFDFAGRRICSSARPVTTTLSGERVEQSAEEWDEKLAQVMADITQYPNVSKSIRLITVACSSSCIVPVDSAGEPLGPVIMVSDRRAREEAEQIRNLPEFETLADEYGFSCNTYSQMARLLWLRKYEPEKYSATARFLSPNDYLIARLTSAAFVTDELNAEKMYFVRENGGYPDALFAAAGLDVRKLPEARPPGSRIGRISSSAASALRLNTNAEVYLSTYDAICSVFGTGVCEEGQASDVSGTVTSVRMYTRKPYVDTKSRIYCQHFSPTGGYLLGGSNNLGGGLVEWAKQCFYKNEEHPYEIMEKEARASRPSHNGIVFVPHLLGARAPSWNSEARGVFFGLERHHTRGDLIRALFESIGFSIREFIDVFHEAGRDVDLITASGGLARIPLANELKAQITRIPYHMMDEFESTCLGAAIIVLSTNGTYASYKNACASMVRTRQIYLPTESHRAYYEDMYGLFRDVAASSEPLFSRRLHILSSLQEPTIDHIENL